MQTNTSPKKTLKVLLTCNQCGLVDFPIQIRARKENENIIDWVEKIVKPKVDKGHFNRSPHCTATELTVLKIPLNKKDDTFIGEAIK